METLNKICKENWNYGKVMELLSQFTEKKLRIIRNEPNLILVQTFSVEPFQKLFIPRPFSVKEKNIGTCSPYCSWCYCYKNRSEQYYKDYTNNGKNQQYIAFDFTREFSRNNSCVVAFTVEEGKITWSHIMDNTLTIYVKDCDPRFKCGVKYIQNQND